MTLIKFSLKICKYGWFVRLGAVFGDTGKKYGSAGYSIFKNEGLYIFEIRFPFYPSKHEIFALK